MKYRFDLKKSNKIKSDFKVMHCFLNKNNICLIHRFKWYIYLCINSEQLSLIESAVGTPLACWLQPGERGWEGRNAY